MDFIRITALTDIGNNIAYSSLIPVVDMAGTPTTKKANLQIVANLVLSGAGGSYFAPAARAILAQSVTNAAQPNITSVGTLSSLTVSGNIGVGNVNATGLASLTTLNVSTSANLGAVSNVTITGGSNGQVLTTNGTGGLSWTTVSSGSSYSNSNVANYLPTFTGTVGANRIASNNASGSNLEISANGAVFTFGQGGALYWPAPGGNQWVIEPNIDNEFEIKSTSNVVISTDINNANAHFTFASDGAVYCPSNAYFEGTRLNVGPGAGNVPLATNPTLVVTDTGLEFIQAALINQSSNGSSDYAAYGADSDETQGFADLGFAGHTFNDPNYTITEPGDGYVFSQGYANGIGGGLVLATGENGNVPDIVFATGGFLANAEFARIDHSANVFHLTRANSGIRFADGTTQTTAATGNIITVNLTGSNANVLYGNGVFAPVTGGGNVSELVNGNNSFVLDSAGNVVFEGTPSGNAVDRGLVWDYGANANGVNSQIRQDFNGLSVRAWTENGGGANGYSPPVNIITNQDAATKTWTFDGQGNLTVPSGSIKSINDGGQLGAYIALTPDLGLARLAGRSSEYTENFNSGGWTSASYTGTQVDIVDAPNLLGFVSNNTIFTSAVDRTFSINGGEPVPYTGYGASGNNVTLYTSITADPDPTVVTSIDFYYQSESYFGIDYDDGGLDMIAAGLTINIDNDQTQGPDINLRSGDDITLQAKNKSLGSESEGGDINIYAGDGAGDDGQGNTSSTGGDIVLAAGDGGYGNGSGGAAGGFTRFQAGDGGDAGVSSAGGAGGFVEISAGNGGTNNGNAQLGAQGGYVDIYAGQTTLANGVGGNVSIRSGTAADGNGVAGNVQIITPISATANGGTWTFDGNGNLTLPSNTFAVNYANGTPVSLGGGNTGNVTFDNVTVQGVNGLNLSAGSDFTANLAYLQVRAGDVASHIHLDTGNNSAYDLIVGDDQNYVQVSSTGNILLSSYDSNTAQYTWTLDYNGNLILAGGNSVIQSVANSSLDPLNPNVSTMVLTPDANYSQQALVLDPTAPGHIHLRAPGANIDEPYANLFLGGELSSFEVGASYGSAPNVYVHSNNNTWTFGTDGNLTIPGSSGGFIKTISNASIGIAAVDNGTNNPAQIMSINAGTGNPTTIISAYASNATIQSNVSGTINTWAFGADGYLTLPTDSVIQGTGNLDIFSGTDGSGNGSPLYIYTSSGNVFGGDLFLDSGAGGTGDGGDIYITGGAGNANVGEGGRIYITGGGGNIGGDIDIVGGSSTQNPPDGGNVRIQSASYIWRFDNVGVATSPVLTYANLSAATIAGKRAFISDANLVAAGNFGNAVSGGGSNTVPVYSDGSVWRIG